MYWQCPAAAELRITTRGESWSLVVLVVGSPGVISEWSSLLSCVRSLLYTGSVRLRVRGFLCTSGLDGPRLSKSSSVRSDCQPPLTRSSGLLKSVLHCRRKSKPQKPALLMLIHKAAFRGGTDVSWFGHGYCRSDLTLQLALKMRPLPFSPKLTDLRARKPPSCLGVTGNILTSPT